MKMNNFVLLFLIVVLSACSSRPSTGCDQSMLDRFLRTKAPEVLIENMGIDSESAASIKEELSLDVELFSDAITVLAVATLTSYGGL